MTTVLYCIVFFFCFSRVFFFRPPSFRLATLPRIFQPNHNPKGKCNGLETHCDFFSAGSCPPADEAIFF